MSGFDRSGLIDACRRHGRVARIVVAQVRGSAPRGVGTAMLVWRDGQSDTIGGGTLEHEATLAARAILNTGPDVTTRHALGPDLGQCCGGAVEILTEIYDLPRAEVLSGDLIVRGPGTPPLSVTRLQAAARNGAALPRAQRIDGWMVEPVARPIQDLWIWGAGHVGRAIVDVMAPLPDLGITWIDTSIDRYPRDIPANVTRLPAAEPARAVQYAPKGARHLIVTYSHALDLSICDAVLRHGFAFSGLIGSQTKWARFRKRLRELGHSDAAIARITCPIGDPATGKHPRVIAIGVAQQLLRLPDTAVKATQPAKNSA